ncbi:MAG: trypsin-like peptidase domain-containing protein [Bacilli bacterium]|nr:trypsin-like peptidase domain-containing protein [Bacilli bacterium]
MNIKKVLLSILLVIVCVFFSALTTLGILYLYPKSTKKVTNVNKLEKEVTITDKGISEAVAKVYDATVVVITNKSGKTVSSGSGFIFKKDSGKAYIITNNHVVSSGDSFSIKLSNEDVLEAKLVGSDTLADIAVLSVDGDKVKSVAKIGKTTDLNVGDTVFAVGAPLDYEAFAFSVTRGVLSGKDRTVEVSLSSSYNADWVMKVIQTDTAINSGNSGGPLCNVNGEVIGVTNMKLAKTGVEGMGFAITIEDALDSADNIIKGIKKEYPYIGISVYNVADLAAYGSTYTQNLSKGVIITKIDEAGSAAKSGFKVGDIILKVDGKEVSSVATFRYELFQHNIGDTVKVVVSRDNEQQTFSLKLEK